MVLFRIHRMKDAPREQFRWAAHTGGVAIVKPKDYEAMGVIEAGSPYAGWKALGERGDPLRTGDLLEELKADGSAGALHITKYVGMENASWFVPEPKPENQSTSAI
jgi:hypothetical protein